MITLYLAGSIRDGHDEDISWREDMITAVQHLPVRVLSPLGGRYFDPTTKLWTLRTGQVDDAKMIVKQDFWYIDQSDVVVFNFLALAQGYPNIGTLVELGRATGTEALIYTIVATTYQGHENPVMYRLHPFLEQTGAVVMHSVEQCREFLTAHLEVLTGVTPRYDAGRVQ